MIGTPTWFRKKTSPSLLAADCYKSNDSHSITTIKKSLSATIDDKGNENTVPLQGAINTSQPQGVVSVTNRSGQMELLSSPTTSSLTITSKPIDAGTTHIIRRFVMTIFFFPGAIVTVIIALVCSGHTVNESLAAMMSPSSSTDYFLSSHHRRHRTDVSSSCSEPTCIGQHPHHPNTVGEYVEETGFYNSIQLTTEPPLVQKQSKYQMIEVRRSPYYGKVLILDGVMQLTERDADSYNEMMAHIPMFQHRHPQRVLIIGGGDGYVLSEVLKHRSVTHVDHVDLDKDVISVCKEHFPWGNTGWDNDVRVALHIADGSTFLHDAPSNFYDVVIQDSSDPWTWNSSGEKVPLPSSVLYSPNHFANIERVLTKHGVFVFQAESLQIPSDLDGIRTWRQLALEVGFQSARYGSIMISSYPTGQIGLLLCEKDANSAPTVNEVQNRYIRDLMDDFTDQNNNCHDSNNNATAAITRTKTTSYYHPGLQTASFVLPKWAMNHIYDESSSPSCLAPSV